jgi:hypothetical protein
MEPPENPGRFTVLFAVVLVRYRALIPLMYLVIIVENVGRIAVGSMKPIVTLATPPGRPGSFVFIAVALVGLVLSLRSEEDTATSASEGRAGG